MIFGLGYDGFHDSGVAMLDQYGGIRFAVSEERFSAIKKDGRFPFQSSMAARKEQSQILCISSLPDEEFQMSYYRANLTPPQNVIHERKRIFLHIKNFQAHFKEFHFISHHDCHAASAYFTSGFKRALIVTWDAGNNSEPWNMTVQLGNGSKLERVEESLDATPARDYAAATALAGFEPNRHEGKITGLAARGNATLENLQRLENLLEQTNGHESLIGRIASWKYVGSSRMIPKLVVDRAYTVRLTKKLGMNREDIAATIQALVEKKVISRISELKKQYGEENICLAGGLFTNVLLNKKIKEIGFKNIYIHPAMGDDGLALGACKYFLGERGIASYLLKDVFFGPDFSDEYIERLLSISRYQYKRLSDIEKQIAEKVYEGKIVARFHGRMEYGPRALGNRSIFCSAENPTINNYLNTKLNRSEFMPFAPITLIDKAVHMYKNIEGGIYTAGFMTIAFDCTVNMKTESPAVVHQDGTARPQLVGEENPSLYSILKEYQAISGRCSMINTSFNMHENPIVCSPDQALLAFCQSKLDYLAIGPFMVSIS